jgi:single-strand DNA-binding protein|tara:strand:+ start:882 stop:1352 length:471 start_codon:yes stop_codon:yes gene_type:complete
MASSLNKVMLIGNLGADPIIRQTQDGKRLAQLSLATSETWKDKNTGEKRDKTQWHRIVIFNDGLAGVVESYLKKGSKVYIEGQLQSRKYTDKDGVEKYTTEIVLANYNGTLTMLDSKGSSGDFSSDSMSQVEQSSGPDSGSSPASDDFDIDDEIPF